MTADEGTVIKIDPETNRVTDEVLDVAGAPSAIAVGAGAVWVGDYSAGTVARIDL